MHQNFHFQKSYVHEVWYGIAITLLQQIDNCVFGVKAFRLHSR